MKHSITIQRLCLFLLVLVLAVPVMAAETVLFNSTESPKSSRVRTLVKGPVTVKFYVCYTSHSGNIYKLKKGTGVTISVQKGYRIRSVVLEDTEGGSRYDKGGLDRIGKYETAPGTNYRMEFVKDSGSQPDDNNIRFSNFDATSDWIYIEGHNMPKKGQLKIRRITVEYVKVVDVEFEKPHYDLYSYSRWFTPKIINNGHTGHIQYGLNNNNIATVLEGGILDIKRPGKGVFTVTYRANGTYAKSECSTTINVIRDKVTFQKKNEVNLLSCYDNYGIFEFIDYTTTSRRDFKVDNGGFSVTSSNPNFIKFDGRLKCGSKAGEAIITIKQAQNDYYEAASFSQTFYVIRRDRDGTMLIKDADEWKLFCKLVNEKGLTALNARLDGDVDLGGDIVMVGHWPNVYTGTFDGQNHTLTMNWDAGAQKQIAPFRIVKDATITNLRTRGQITSSGYFLSGFIDDVYGGKNSISNCVSEVNITSSYNEGSSDVAGMAAYIYSGSVVTFDDCIVKGTLKATTDKGKKAVSGFVHGQYGTCTLTNCLYIGDNNATGGNTFAANATVTNCYYLKACGKEQGKQVTKDQLNSGEVAHKLQAGRYYTSWGQTLGNDPQPRLTNDPAQRAYEVKFSYKGKVKTTRYANGGKGIYGTLPTAKEMLGSDFNPQDTYNLTFSGKFTTSTPVTADCTVIVAILINNCYMIGSKEEWKEFCELVMNGETKLNAKMTADVNLGTDITMVGNNSYSYVIAASGKPYSGTFDGQGHTLKVNWNSSTIKHLAPFMYVDGATIKNLCVKGSIISKVNYGNVGGLISSSEGNTTITNCVADIYLRTTDSYIGGMICDADRGSLTMTNCVTTGVIVSNKKGSGGMIGTIFKARTTMTDCLVKVELRPESNDAYGEMSGFVYYIWHENPDDICTLNNCLYLGWGDVSQIGGSLRTFAPEWYSVLNNCYHLNICSDTPQGTRVTEKQLKSGEVTKLLQNNRTDACHWAQTLGEMPDLYHAADKSKTNYVYYDKANSRWACEDFRLTDGTPLPIGIDFIATKATYERPFSSKNNATLCLPYELPRNGSFTAYNLSAGSNSSISFKKTEDKLGAYRPYYITADGTPQLDGYNLQVKAYKDDDLKQPAGAFSFVGTVDGVSNATAAADNAYILQPDGKFHKVTTENPGATVPAYRAYITCPKTLGAKEFSVILEGETTGIDGVKNGTTDGPVYDLQGRRVADRLDDAVRHQLPAGVYIVGGRKVVVK